MVRLLTQILNLSNSPRIRSAHKTPILRRHFLDQRHRLNGYLWFGSSCSGCVLPEQSKSLAMPAQARLWLDNEKRLLPGPNHPCEKHRERPIRFDTGGSFHVSVQDDQLLTGERVFCHQLGLRSGEVSHGSQRE
jgi:hypothetical protein